MKTPDDKRYRMNVYISRDLAKRVRMAALQADMRISEYVESLLAKEVQDENLT